MPRAGVPSQTAAVVALFRARERGRPADTRRLDDPYAARFLELAGYGDADTLEHGFVPGLLDLAFQASLIPLAPLVVERHRLMDDLLAAAIAGGIRQVVVLGAGYDARAYRWPAHQAPDRWIEVDLPPLSARKRDLVEKVVGETPKVTFAAVDFERDDLVTRLTESGLDPEAPAAFLWEGVTPYLTEEAIAATLHAVRSAAASGSLVTFDAFLGPQVRGIPGALIEHVPRLFMRAIGEPLLSHFDGDTRSPLRLLSRCGLQPIAMYRSRELLGRYGKRWLPSERLERFTGSPLVVVEART